MLRCGFLSAKERTVLQAVMRHPSEIHGVARRANAILLLDDGWNCAKVAEALYLDDDTVRTWFKRYQAGGLDEMTMFDWKERSGYLSRERMAELSARLGERLMRDSGEVAVYIAARWVWAARNKRISGLCRTIPDAGGRRGVESRGCGLRSSADGADRRGKK